MLPKTFWDVRETGPRSGKKKAFLAKHTSFCSCSSASFNCSAFNEVAGELHWVPWSTKTGFRVAAELVSLLVEIGGLCSLRFFLCSQFPTAVLTTSFASGIETGWPLIDTCSIKFRMSFFSLFLSCVLILLIPLAPLSGQALVQIGQLRRARQ